jgi:hypothetical protein
MAIEWIVKRHNEYDRGKIETMVEPNSRSHVKQILSTDDGQHGQHGQHVVLVVVVVLRIALVPVPTQPHHEEELLVSDHHQRVKHVILEHVIHIVGTLELRELVAGMVDQDIIL